MNAAPGQSKARSESNYWRWPTESDERLILPPPMPGPSIMYAEQDPAMGLSAAIARVLAHEAEAAFDARDVALFRGALEALVKLGVGFGAERAMVVERCATKCPP